MSLNLRRKQPGQSIPLLALMLVVIIGAVGLSVDVGNAYGRQRTAQNNANAGALAGMSAALDGKNNQAVWDNVRTALAGNRVAVETAPYTYRAEYVDRSGNIQLLCQWPSSGATCGDGSLIARGSTNPNLDTLSRVQVSITERLDTYFARVVGRDTLTVNAKGAACLGAFSIGVMPLGIPLYLQPYNDDDPSKPRYHRLYKADNRFDPPRLTEMLPPGEPGATNASRNLWNEVTSGNWDNMEDIVIELPFINDNDMPGTHMGWLNWNGQYQDAPQFPQYSASNGGPIMGSNSNSASNLTGGLTWPGTFYQGFHEGYQPQNTHPGSTYWNKPPFNTLTRGDWIDGNTGVVATTQGEFDQMINDKREVMLPIFDAFGKDGGKASFHYYQMGQFRIWQADLTGNPKFVRVQYRKDMTHGNPRQCAH